MPGDIWANANVTVDGTLIKGVRAIIYKSTARLLDPDGTVRQQMIGPITISDYSTGQGVTWTNGVETWSIVNAGCNCGH